MSKELSVVPVLDDTPPANAPTGFRLLVKPGVSTCKLDFALSRDDDPGQNYLCAGLELSFTHTSPAMVTIAQPLQQGRVPSDVIAVAVAEDAKRGSRFGRLSPEMNSRHKAGQSE